MLSAFPACFYKEDTGYSVIFPDLNWTATCGKDLNEALTMAVDCLAGYLYSCKKEHEKAPVPSPLHAFSPDEIARELGITAYSEAFINLVTVDVDEYARKHFEKSVKKTLTIPFWLNEAATAAGINFSQVLQEALMLKLQTK